MRIGNSRFAFLRKSLNLGLDEIDRETRFFDMKQCNEIVQQVEKLKVSFFLKVCRFPTYCSLL